MDDEDFGYVSAARGIYSTCLAALNHFGEQRQKLKTIEELAELIVELSRHSFYPDDYHAEKIADEIADVWITTLQVAQSVGIQSVIKRIDFKINRLQDLVNKEKSKID